jgi:hypothetical protein
VCVSERVSVLVSLSLRLTLHVLEYGCAVFVFGVRVCVCVSCV